jgi:BirA family transcriptional regulator, biotin operon repressor / biotin---[acetyl-CoA-carboxylase] ligase
MVCINIKLTGYKMNKQNLQFFIFYTMTAKKRISRFIRFDELDSTNKKARELLNVGAIPEGTIISAHNQLAGKGYGSNKWESAPGENLTISCILYPAFLAPHRQFKLTMAISLAVADTIKQFIYEKLTVTVKWPNDIYAGRDKIAGILIENSIMGEHIKDSICGIGLNVNQKVFLSDAPNPVSLRKITGITYNNKEIMEELCNHIDTRYEQLRNNELRSLEDEYHQSLYLIGVESSFRSQNESFSGTIAGTDEFGRLIIKTSEGERHFDFKEVEFVRV